MKTNILWMALAMGVATASFTGCNSNSNQRNSSNGTPATTAETPMTGHADNTRNSVDYEGTYTGTFPCADCSGIEIEITLRGDEYKKKMVYKGKAEGQNSFEESGRYTWNNEGNKITLNGSQSEQYLVGEGRMYALDLDGNTISGDLADMYILNKK